MNHIRIGTVRSIAGGDESGVFLLGLSAVTRTQVWLQRSEGIVPRILVRQTISPDNIVFNSIERRGFNLAKKARAPPRRSS